jgi:FAD/FMN-containing dehydrogenase
MNGLRVDLGARTARVEAGVRMEQVASEAARHGLAPLSGSSPGVGAVGFTLGGGLPLTGRQHGWAADRVLSIEVVTPDARLHQVTAEHDPELFWALRGGRDNFGVVTALTVGLLPEPELFGGSLVFDGAHAEEVLSGYLEWTREVPEAMSSAAQAIVLPKIPAVPEPMRGRHLVTLTLVHTGDVAEGERLAAPLRALAPVQRDTLGVVAYRDSASIHQDPTDPHPYEGDNALLSDLDGKVLTQIARLTGPEAPGMTVLQLSHLGGALGRPSAVANAVGHREASHLLRMLSVVDADGGFGTEAIRALHGRLRGLVLPQTLGRSLNFMFGGQATPELVRSAYRPEDYRRLAALKAEYDPSNLFRLNYNIPPAA